MVCPKCSEKLVRYEEEDGFHLDLKPRSPSLLEYVKKAFEFQVDGYRCESCQHVSDRKRTRRLAYSPETLVIQLKRFSQSFTTNKYSKDSVDVKIETSLDLNPFRTTTNKAMSQYQLSAVVLHTGSLIGGHYIAAAKGPDGNWSIFDDKQKPKPTTAAQATKGGNGFTPYMLFYQKRKVPLSSYSSSSSS